MDDRIELLMASEPREFESKNGIMIRYAEPPSITKAFGGTEEGLTALLGGLSGRVLSDVELPIKKRTYVLYRFAGRIDLSASKASRANEGDLDELTRLFSLMYEETEGRSIPEYCAKCFAVKKHRDVFVIRGSGHLLGMARIAYRGKIYGRINTVVTSYEYRGKGVAKALVTAICSALISEGITPTVLADKENHAANGLYQSIGFRKECELYEYVLSSDLSENPLIMNTLS